MTLRERLWMLGYKDSQLKKALLAFQRDFHTSKSKALSKLTLLRLRKLTDGNMKLNLLSRIIHSESNGEPYRGMVAVGAVVLNRLKSHQFPNSLTAVITQPLAFTVVQNGRFWLEPTLLSYKEAKEAFSGTDPTGNCLFFFNPDLSSSRWILRLRPKLRIGRHVFA